MQTLCPESGLRTAPNWPKIRKMTMTSQFSDMTSTSNFFDVVLFLLSSLVTGPSFISISSLVLELWQFLFIRDWPEIRKSEIPPSEFCQISRDWGEQRLPNLAWTLLIKFYWILQNARVTAFSISELLMQNLPGEVILAPPPLGLMNMSWTGVLSYFREHSVELIPRPWKPLDITLKI